MREVLVGCYLLSLAGCGEGWDYPSGPKIDPSIFEPGDPNRVQVKTARLRSTPGGCEVDVTFTNVSDKSLSAGFQYDVLDAASRQVASRSTAVQQAAPGETRTVSSEGTTDGPSGVPCPAGGRARLTKVTVYNF
jgi:hypothetical protein